MKDIRSNCNLELFLRFLPTLDSWQRSPFRWHSSSWTIAHLSRSGFESVGSSFVLRPGKSKLGIEKPIKDFSHYEANKINNPFILLSTCIAANGNNNDQLEKLTCNVALRSFPGWICAFSRKSLTAVSNSCHLCWAADAADWDSLFSLSRSPFCLRIEHKKLASHSGNSNNTRKFCSRSAISQSHRFVWDTTLVILREQL